MRDSKLRIAVVSPLMESVPPRLYGGTERVVSYLTEALVEQGHEVALFASGDSQTRGRLHAMTDEGLRLLSLDGRSVDPFPHYALMLDRIAEVASEFDVIHFNIDYWHFPLARRLGWPTVTTLHGRLDYPDLVPLYRYFRDMPLVSISDAQRLPLPWVPWMATIHHGLPEDLYGFHPQPGKYLAFLGRMSPEKGPERAIRLARRVGIPLKMAAKVDRDDRDYFEQRIRPLLTGPDVEYLGEIGDAEKEAFLGNALALLFPIDWPEPFGIVMIEAMACGTPVIAWPCGSVPEVVKQGISGYLVETDDAAVAAIAACHAHDRARCREAFMQGFTASRMAQDYVSVYRRIASAADRVGQVKPVSLS
ncbi:MAG TPA: glycosyltransferase family 4 protein [Rhodocyclaceae bacterium]|nr:glycosyltransferase family 4 protein [Rhodocyclaceae bacterium]